MRSLFVQGFGFQQLNFIDSCVKAKTTLFQRYMHLAGHVGRIVHGVCLVMKVPEPCLFLTSMHIMRTHIYAYTHSPLPPLVYNPAFTFTSIFTKLFLQVVVFQPFLLGGAEELLLPFSLLHSHDGWSCASMVFKHKRTYKGS